MQAEIIVAVLSLIGTAAGSITGVMTANRLTNYRIQELEKKVDKHNQLVERVALLEQGEKIQRERIEEVREHIEQIRKEAE